MNRELYFQLFGPKSEDLPCPIAKWTDLPIAFEFDGFAAASKQSPAPLEAVPVNGEWLADKVGWNGMKHTFIFETAS
ncbi:hypothetical protein N183_37555 [Sinorhizobium sp. Sb3]|nr:hypothetical protein N183_37555 [Sinorhizobium sp. Sb3]